eukprot:scaffold142089_cov32-Tisochrysis_lutea.AAC.3
MPKNRKTPSRHPCGMVASAGRAKTVQSTATDCRRLDQRVSTTWLNTSYVPPPWRGFISTVASARVWRGACGIRPLPGGTPTSPRRKEEGGQHQCGHGGQCNVPALERAREVVGAVCHVIEGDLLGRLDGGWRARDERVEPRTREGGQEARLIRHLEAGVANCLVDFWDVGEPCEDDQREWRGVVGEESAPASVEQAPGLRVVQRHAHHVRADGEAEVGKGGAPLSRTIGGKACTERCLLETGAVEYGREEGNKGVPDVRDGYEEAEDFAREGGRLVHEANCARNGQRNVHDA